MGVRCTHTHTHTRCTKLCSSIFIVDRINFLIKTTIKINPCVQWCVGVSVCASGWCTDVRLHNGKIASLEHNLNEHKAYPEPTYTQNMHNPILMNRCLTLFGSFEFLKVVGLRRMQWILVCQFYFRVLLLQYATHHCELFHCSCQGPAETTKQMQLFGNRKSLNTMLLYANRTNLLIRPIFNDTTCVTMIWQNAAYMRYASLSNKYCANENPSIWWLFMINVFDMWNFAYVHSSCDFQYPALSLTRCGDTRTKMNDRNYHSYRYQSCLQKGTYLHFIIFVAGVRLLYIIYDDFVI